jgi:TctA family transporter
MRRSRAGCLGRVLCEGIADGFVWTKLGFPAPPLLLGFVLGPMMEEHLRRAI